MKDKMGKIEKSDRQFYACTFPKKQKIMKIGDDDAVDN